MTVAALRPAIIGLVLLAPAGIRPAAAEPDLCQADGSPFWLSRMGDRSNEAALPAPTQAGIDALRDRRATAISLQGLLGNKRVCPVSDFSELSRVVGLTAVDDLPTECLAAFARTARLPALRAIAVMCGDDTAIDLQKLLDYQALEAVRLVFGCRLGPTGLAPLAKLPRLRMLVDADGGSIAGLDALTGLTDLVMVSPQGTVPPIAKLRALRSLEITLYQPVDLSPLGALTTLEELVISAQAGGPVDVAPLAQLTRLRRLEVRAETLTHAAALGQLPNLCAIELTKAQTGVDLKALAGLGRLQTLRINAAAGPSLAALARAQALETLELWSGCARPAIDLAPLAKLPRLQHVLLEGAMTIRNRDALGDKIQQMRPYHCGGRGRGLRRIPPT
jgi:hypothetical protein